MLMKSTKYIYIIITLLFLSQQINAQTGSDFQKRIDGKTNILVSFYHSGGYQKARRFCFLDQSFEYRFHRKYSAGLGFGINLYPAAIATPFFINGRYHFSIRKINCSIEQSIGKNIKIQEYGFNSNRYFGAIGVDFNLRKYLSLNTQVGYLYLWDKYGGEELSLVATLGLTYKFIKISK